ncbi:Clr5 domain-containing protein [Schizothecium vesticola]|uniref:Clr5 domain-containing protein n=1 Tax=Schizothecium vesticola TaxID=314040 RepID=A0AA40K5K5_9PEZI|nr:Clr5 domain-containing protein [Schizothecium vesticola]
MAREFKFVSGPGPPRAPPVSSSDWETHRATIYYLWKSRNMPLKQLMDTMRSEHSFAPSRKQYVLQLKKWGMHKYTPARPSANKRPHPSPSPDPQVSCRQTKKVQDSKRAQESNRSQIQE